MKRVRKAFTLIEFIISLGLSLTILLAAIRLLSSVSGYYYTVKVDANRCNYANKALISIIHNIGLGDKFIKTPANKLVYGIDYIDNRLIIRKGIDDEIEYTIKKQNLSNGKKSNDLYYCENGVPVLLLARGVSGFTCSTSQSNVFVTISVGGKKFQYVYFKKAYI